MITDEMLIGVEGVTRYDDFDHLQHRNVDDEIRFHHISHNSIHHTIPDELHRYGDVHDQQAAIILHNRDTILTK